MGEYFLVNILDLIVSGIWRFSADIQPCLCSIEIVYFGEIVIGCTDLGGFV